jgi:hypothetical protein
MRRTAWSNFFVLRDAVIDEIPSVQRTSHLLVPAVYEKADVLLDFGHLLL